METSYTRVHRLAAAAVEAYLQDADRHFMARVSFKGGSALDTITEKAAALQGRTGFVIPDAGIASRDNPLDKDAWDNMVRYCNKLRRSPAYSDPLFALLESGDWVICSHCGEAMPHDTRHFYYKDGDRTRLDAKCKTCHNIKCVDRRRKKVYAEVIGKVA